jgi:hypothetical protein
MTYHVVVIFSIFLFIAVAMLDTLWGMGNKLFIAAAAAAKRGTGRRSPPRP